MNGHKIRKGEQQSAYLRGYPEADNGDHHERVSFYHSWEHRWGHRWRKHWCKTLTEQHPHNTCICFFRSALNYKLSIHSQYTCIPEAIATEYDTANSPCTQTEHAY